MGSLGCLRLAYGPERVMDEFGCNATVALHLWGLRRKERKKVAAYAATFFLLDITGINDILEIKYIT